MRIIDAHVHLGNQPFKQYTPEDLAADLARCNADGAVLFAFPEDMYRCIDSDESRRQANDYVLASAQDNPRLYPFYFIWNGYAQPSDWQPWRGIKWHRHADEPRYDYEDPRCEAILQAIRAHNLPVILEEEFPATVAFIERNPQLNIIIPHMGSLNGGYEAVEAFYSNPHIYYGTSTAELVAIEKALDNVGVERVIFGSDVSGTGLPYFNFPYVELEKIMKLGLTEDELGPILGGSIQRLIGQPD